MRLRRVLLALVGLTAGVVGMGMALYPAVAAYACPACFGFVRLHDGLFADAGMTREQQARLEADYAVAVQRVARFYGRFSPPPAVLVCATAHCDRRLGGKGAAARTFGSTFIQVSPRGISAVVLAHEFSHVELHRRTGLWRLISLPAWFDEGLAVIVSDDARYLNPVLAGTGPCGEPPGGLPSDMFHWARAAGHTPGLYASAACKVRRWMEENGGRDGLIAAIDAFSGGRRSLP